MDSQEHLHRRCCFLDNQQEASASFSPPSCRLNKPNTTLIVTFLHVLFLLHVYCQNRKQKATRKLSKQPLVTSCQRQLYRLSSWFFFLPFSNLISHRSTPRWFSRSKTVLSFLWCQVAVSHEKLPENEPIFEPRSRSRIKGESLWPHFMF